MTRNVLISIGLFIAGMATGIVAVNIYNTDLLSSEVDESVLLEDSVTVINQEGVELRLPAGIGLQYNKKYHGLAYTEITVIFRGDSMLSKTEEKGVSMYFDESIGE